MDKYIEGLQLDFKTQKAFNRAITICKANLEDYAYQVSGFQILFEDEADARRLFPEIFEPQKHQMRYGLKTFGLILLGLLAVAAIAYVLSIVF